MNKSKIKIGKRLMAYDPKGCRQWKYIGTIQGIKGDEITIYNEKLPIDYKVYCMTYNQISKFLKEKLYK